MTLIMVWPCNGYGNGWWKSNQEVVEANREEAKKEVESGKKEERWKGEDQEGKYLTAKTDYAIDIFFSVVQVLYVWGCCITFW